MKKICLTLLAAGAVIACTREPAVLQPGLPEQTFTGTFIETRTVMEGNKVLWEDQDAISVYNGSESVPFRTTLDAPAASASFSGHLADADTYSAMYPADGLGTWSGAGDFTFTIPALQRAVAGTVDPAADFMAAVTTGEERSFTFSHLLGAVKFTVGTESPAITSITIKAGRNAAGGYRYTASSGVAAWYTAGIQAVTLLREDGGVLDPVDYYVALGAREYDNGLTYIFTDEEGATASVEKPGRSVVRPGVIYPVGTIRDLDFGDGVQLEPFTPKTYQKPAYGFFDTDADASAIVWDRMTHLVLCSATFNADGTVNYPFGGDTDRLRTLVNTAHSNGVAVLLQFAGDHDPVQGKHVWNSMKFYDAAVDAATNEALVSEMVSFTRINGLDGLNIFMDKATSSETGYPEAEKLAAFYGKLLAAKPSKTRTGQPFTMSLCTISEVNSALLPKGKLDDFVTLDGWDAIFTMVFGMETTQNTSLAPQDYVKSELNYWQGKGVPASKLVVTIPAIVGCFDGSALTWIPWYQIFTLVEDTVANITSKNNYTNVGDYQWIRYDGFPWIGTKAGYLQSPGAGAMALWKVDFDAAADDASMMNRIKTLLGN